MSLGFGAMIHALGGGSPESAEKYYGRKIKAAKFDNDELLITFEDGVTIRVYDGGQSCCESRYMTTDDDPQDLVGKTLTKVEVKYAEADRNEEDEDDYSYSDVHEIAFLEFQADHETVTFATHNEHNGYYGGFGLSIEEVA